MNESAGRELPAAVTGIPPAAMAELCHLVRTPLNGVLGSLELLLERDLPAPDAELARSAYDAAMALHLLFEHDLEARQAP